MTNVTVIFLEWGGDATFETEAEASDGGWLSLYVGAVQDCPWGRWLWTVDTRENAGQHELRPIGMGITYSPETAMTEAEAAARHWLRPTPRLESVA